MSQAILKQYMGEAGAGGAADHAPSATPSKLYDVLKELARPRPLVSAYVVGTVATGILARVPITAPDTLRELAVRLEVCGSAGATTIQARLNGVLITNGAITIDNTATDPTQVKVALGGVDGIDVKDGDIVDINCSAAPTGGSGLSATIRSGGVRIE